MFFCFRASLACTARSRHTRTFLQQRQAVGDGAGGGAAAVPAHHDAIELQAGFLNERDEDHRPAGIKQRGFVEDFIRQTLLSFGLADHEQIEAAPEPADTSPAADTLAISIRLSIGDADTLGGSLEALDRGARLLVRFRTLGFDEFRRNAAHHRAGNDRLIGKPSPITCA